MTRIEKKLKSLPKKRLGLLATGRIFFRLTNKLWNEGEENKKNWAFLYLRPVAVGVTLSFLLLVIIPGYAYASKQVTYGDLLYPVKKGLEKIELSLANTPEKESEKKEKFIERRLEEAEVLSEEQEEEVSEAIVKTINEVTKLQKEVKEEKKDSQELKNQEKKIAALSEIARMVGIEASEEVVDSVAEALETIKTPRGQEKRKNYERPERGFARFPEASNTPEKVEGENEEENSSDETEEENNLKPKKKAGTEEVRQSYEELREIVSSFRDNLKEDEYEEEDIEELSEKLETKLEKAGTALEEENLGQAEGLIKATEALTNNAKHFMKWKEKEDKKGSNSKNSKNGKKDDDEEVDDEITNGFEDDDTLLLDKKKDDEEEDKNKKNWLKYQFNWKK